jgi:hypothetical protein
MSIFVKPTANRGAMLAGRRPHSSSRVTRRKTPAIQHETTISGTARAKSLPGVAVRELERSRLYSEELGINLARGTEREYFLWFLASLLFGGHISETIAKNTYHTFVRHGLTTPRRILAAGWDFLVCPIMREGGYVRYDGLKSDQVLRDCQSLVDDYQGSLARLHDVAGDARDLERRLHAFHGVGPVTVNIFLRELRPFWAKADPAPLPIVRLIARRLSIDLTRYERKSHRFTRLEAGLIRLHRYRA